MSVTSFDHRVITRRFFAIRNLSGVGSNLICRIDSRNPDGSIDVTVQNGAYGASISADGTFTCTQNSTLRYNVELIWQGNLPSHGVREFECNEALNYIDRQILAGLSGVTKIEDRMVRIQHGFVQDAINRLYQAGHDVMADHLSNALRAS
ncbi:hypothetical protein ACOI1H_19125 [Loktanella sp. DJP18]|uniref:hypothetical protein n=1 Tax=Loktanella sp. DJP18 TaxID=3409788 RepID=UPI003BB5CBE1